MERGASARSARFLEKLLGHLLPIIVFSIELQELVSQTLHHFDNLIVSEREGSGRVKREGEPSAWGHGMNYIVINSEINQIISYLV